MNINSILGRNTVSSLKKSSGDAISIFSKTINKLKEINETISQEKLVKNEKVLELQSELSDLDTQEKQNSIIITKIENILN